MMLCICFACVYYICDCELIRKRKQHLYEYYTSQIENLLYEQENPYNTPGVYNYVQQQIDQEEDKMHQDGFSWKEVTLTRPKGRGFPEA